VKNKAIICILLLFASSAQASRVVGYLSLWGLKTGFSADQIRGDLLTDVVYSFLDISADGECKILSESPQDEKLTLTTFAQLTKLKKKYPRLKTIISVGGWGSSVLFSDVAWSDSSRKKFVRSCVRMMKKYSFDGIDVDWEFPVSGGLPKNHYNEKDRSNFTHLIAEFRKQLGHSKSLSIAVSPLLSNLNNLQVNKLATYLDWFGVMAYDFCNLDSQATCHHAAFDPMGKNALQWFARNRIKSRQIILGVPFYGYQWKVLSANDSGLGQKVDHTNPASNTRPSYVQIMGQSYSKDWYHWDSVAKEPWLFNPTSLTMTSFENEESLALKVSYVKKNKLGGIMIWELSGDTANHSLLKAIKLH